MCKTKTTLQRVSMFLLMAKHAYFVRMNLYVELL